MGHRGGCRLATIGGQKGELEGVPLEGVSVGWVWLLKSVSVMLLVSDRYWENNRPVLLGNPLH